MQNIERIARWRRENPASVAKYNRISKLNRLGITQEEFDGLLAEQQGKCAIDGCMGAAEHIDHDHKTGQIRGLLCGRCNPGLGLFDDDPAKLFAAAKYLESRESMALLGGTRLQRKPLSEEARQRMSDRMKGNRFAIGNRASTGRKCSEEERVQRSIEGKKRWVQMKPEQQEKYRNNGRNNAQKRWRKRPSETQASQFKM